MPKALADMNVPPAFRTWGARIGGAVAIALVIGYVPSQLLRPDPRTEKLEAEIAELEKEATAIAAHDAELLREIQALRTDVAAIEARARADLGMVYPDEIVLRVGTSIAGAAAPSPAKKAAP